jgi:hypothetical protein
MDDCKAVKEKRGQWRGVAMYRIGKSVHYFYSTLHWSPDQRIKPGEKKK